METLGIKIVSDKEKTTLKYETAYQLIDQGGKNNYNRAETILEEIINSNDEFPERTLNWQG